MILAIPINSAEETSKVSELFARSSYFAIVDKTKGALQFIENECVNDDNEVGRKVVMSLKKKYDVDTLVAFELGFKVQKISKKQELNLIILPRKNTKLKDLLNYIIYENSNTNQR